VGELRALGKVLLPSLSFASFPFPLVLLPPPTATGEPLCQPEGEGEGMKVLLHG